MKTISVDKYLKRFLFAKNDQDIGISMDDQLKIAKEWHINLAKFRIMSIENICVLFVLNFLHLLRRCFQIKNVAIQTIFELIFFRSNYYLTATITNIKPVQKTYRREITEQNVRT